MDANIQTLSYTSASMLPAKLIQRGCAVDGLIRPVHAQILPTNRCNLNCRFCSCRNRDRGLELEWPRLERCLVTLRALGCQAITVTGGGEPLLYPYIEDLVNRAKELGLEVGIVTNGTMMRCWPGPVTWCRISASDEANRIPLFYETVSVSPWIDWAISYVVSSEPDIDNIAAHVQCANSLDMTHLRLVSDLVDLDRVPSMNQIRDQIRARGIDDRKVIYQGRKEWTRGVPRCLISLLKPVIGPDGGIYPCCGVQYAAQEQALDMVAGWSMGQIEDLAEIYGRQRHFDGARCARCYYGDYNTVLAAMHGRLHHREFV